MQPSWACVACSSSLGAAPVCGSHTCLGCLGCPRSRPSPWGSGIRCDPRVTVISCPGRDGQSHRAGLLDPHPSSALLATEPSLPPDLRTPTRGRGRQDSQLRSPSHLPASARAYSSSREQVLVLGCVHMCACVWSGGPVRCTPSHLHTANILPYR